MMPRAPIRFPDRNLAHDLVEVTEYLCAAAARAVGASLPPPASPEWTPRRIALTPMLAHLHGIAPLLATTPDALPVASAEAFRRHHALSLARSSRLMALRDAFLAEAAACGVSPVALKGARSADTLYRETALRPMADLDFLCPPENLEAARNAALRLGLVALAGNARHTTFGSLNANVVSLLTEHPDNPIQIELHTRLAESFAGQPIDITPALFDPGGQAGHALHALLHASHHASVRTLRFCQVIDIGLMLRGFERTGWQSLPGAMREFGMWWAYSPLSLVSAYFPGSVPAGILAEARRAAPVLARRAAWRISDVSYSALGDGGLGVRLRWARRLDQGALHLLRAGLNARGAGNAKGAPGLAPELGIPAVGRARRIAAWLTGRSARPVSARLVQLALEAVELPA